jgi:hypothetical protein
MTLRPMPLNCTSTLLLPRPARPKRVIQPKHFRLLKISTTLLLMNKSQHRNILNMKKYGNRTLTNVNNNMLKELKRTWINTTMNSKSIQKKPK